MDTSYPAWLWIRKAPLRLTNREFKAMEAYVRVGLTYLFAGLKVFRENYNLFYRFVTY